MDSQDASALHPHFLFHHHAHPHHHSQPPPMSHPAVLLGPHSQTQPHLPNNSYQLPNSSSSVNPASTAPTNNPFLQQQNPRFPFNTMAAAAPSGPKPPDHMQADGSNSGGGGVAGAFSVEPTRKRRGRPRKYSPDNSIGLGLSPAPVSQISSAAAHNDSGGGGGTPSSDTPAKRNRGRPPGSVKRQLNALGIPGVGFTPHVITVNAGEDVASKIMAFSQQGPRTVCILSANGAICSVTLRQPATSGGTVTYEGRFEIISLSGSLQQSENDDNHSGAGGGLSVSLAGSEGRVLGGGVAGILKAASSVQIVVGSFIADGKKSKSQTSPGTTTNMFNFGTGPSSSSESGENDESPLNRGAVGGYNSGQAPIQNMYSSMGWPNMNMLPQ